MRMYVRIAMLFFIAVGTAAADTIVLKSGRRIAATNVVEEGDRVYYETPAGRLSLRKAQVERIERGGEGASVWGEKTGLPIPELQIEAEEGFEDVVQATVVNGAIDRSYILRLETQVQSSSPQAAKRAAVAHYSAAQFLAGKGRLEEGIEHYRRALTFAPDYLRALLNISQLHLRKSEYSLALEFLERAERMNPESADVAKMKGWAYYGQNKIEQAVREWKLAYSLRPDADVERALAKAQRDEAAESEFKEGETRHFQMRYHGGAAPELAKEVLRTLERHFRAIESELNYTPPESIGVILYTERAFMDVTRAPGWVAAANDGRIRVPVQGLTWVDPELSRVLRHELVHSFTGQKTRLRCPTWLDEGVAQFIEGSRIEPDAAAAFVRAYEEQQRVLPLARMEGTWMNLPGDAAATFYAWSLGVVEYLIRTYGMGDIERVLEALNSEPSAEAAFRSIYRMDYSEIQQEAVKYLKRNYAQ